MPWSAPPPPSRPQDKVNLLVRSAATLGLAAAGAMVCVLPATLRVAAPLSGGTDGLRVWMALGAATLGPMVAAIVVLRGAEAGLRAWIGPDGALPWFGVGLWFASLLVVLTIFGAALRATTHHHALAAVTYAFGALFLATALGLACARVTAILRVASPAARSLLVGSLGGAVAVAVGAVGLRFVGTVLRDAASASAAATIVDMLTFVLAAFVASRRIVMSRGAARKAIAFVGAPMAFLIAAAGVSTLRDAALRDAIGERAPAFAPAANLVSGR